MDIVSDGREKGFVDTEIVVLFKHLFIQNK